uniref:Uncharacterized protein n=1 Tax=Aegilops tauschii subsp. strangulata TaxID=200361 RepID=A0A453MR51_AEGTS
MVPRLQRCCTIRNMQFQLYRSSLQFRMKAWT